MMRFGSLFSGIGGLELGLEWSGLGHTEWQVECDPFCNAVLRARYPNVRRYSDVRSVGAHNLAPVDLICGGFPCQDVSSAGKGEGLAGERSGLWREYARIVAELRPRWVVVENVAGGASRWFDQVVSDLEEHHYEVLPVPLSASDVGAPHLRNRIFLVAYRAESVGSGRQAVLPALANSNSGGRESERGTQPGAQQGAQRYKPNGCSALWKLHDVADRSAIWASEPAVGRVADGVSRRAHRLRACGNAVVPQCAEVIGYLIQELSGQSDNARTIVT